MASVSRNFTGRGWWLFTILLCLALEGVALYYQYALNYLPCVLCIHVRMLLAAILILAILGWLGAGSKVWSMLMLLLSLGFWVWMTERSVQLLGVEQGWILGECDMRSGLPEWLALESWFPWLFHIHEPCGYTPYLVAEISMAEVLIVMSPLMAILTIVVMIQRARSRR